LKVSGVCGMCKKKIETAAKTGGCQLCRVERNL
jgi:hypothetical protein